MSHQSQHCVACHAIVLLPHWATDYDLEHAGWVKRDGLWYCSQAHADQGVTKQIRKSVGVSHMRFDNRASPAYRLGAYAAVQGFDVVSKDPEYVKGHTFGMSMRTLVEAIPWPKEAKP